MFNLALVHCSGSARRIKVSSEMVQIEKQLKMVISCERTLGPSNLAWGADYAACVSSNNFKSTDVYGGLSWIVRSMIGFLKYFLSIFLAGLPSTFLSSERIFLLLCCLLVGRSVTSTADACTKPR